MKKKALLAALSLSFVVGLGGIAIAAPSDNTTKEQPTASEMQAYMENQDIPSTEDDKEVSSDNAQLSQEKADIFNQMVESGMMTEEQLENMPMNAQDMSAVREQMVESGMMTEEQLKNISKMPMNGQMNEQLENMPQQNIHGQGMTGNHMSNAQQGHKSGGNNMMGSSGRMGR
ncbi:hypothetical protein [Desulfitobacterium hafniense]|uniref:Uncharacterized protein n=1 Tax=Desulfitobacterium hafniense (strain Y51) TaxID=138119 RepID=Q24NU0_DESHY|nr:hypothetical protein [Desulfitobacterium hafniense]BAE86302.1 hypothetical protein DSY4513 [Desulfitobacterium hafniense Y51]